MPQKISSPTDQLPVPVESVERRIYVIRGQKVMLDSDLAELYQVETRTLVQAVKRNMDRFPEDFMFQLTHEEGESLRSQIVISNEVRGGRRYLPYVFTEHGALMLSSVLKSKRAVQMSIRVVRVFIGLREMLATHKDLATRMEKLEAGQKGHASILSVIVEEIKKLKQRPGATTQTAYWLPLPWRERLTPCAMRSQFVISNARLDRERRSRRVDLPARATIYHLHRMDTHGILSRQPQRHDHRRRCGDSRHRQNPAD